MKHVEGQRSRGVSSGQISPSKDGGTVLFLCVASGISSWHLWTGHRIRTISKLCRWHTVWPGTYMSGFEVRLSWCLVLASPLTCCPIVKVNNKGVSVMVQQKWIWLVSMKMQVWPLALLSGLKIQYCRDIQCRSMTRLRSGVAVTVV